MLLGAKVPLLNFLQYFFSKVVLLEVLCPLFACHEKDKAPTPFCRDLKFTVLLKERNLFSEFLRISFFYIGDRFISLGSIGTLRDSAVPLSLPAIQRKSLADSSVCLPAKSSSLFSDYSFISRAKSVQQARPEPDRAPLQKCLTLSTSLIAM